MEISKEAIDKIKGGNFIVIFNGKGQPAYVIGPNGKKVSKKKLSTNPITGPIDGVEFGAVLFKPGKSPCCYQWDDQCWCWC